MKIFSTSFFFLFQLTICLKAYGQITNREDFALPINSDQFENVFDGFHYKGNEPPLVIPSIRILIINDSLRLRSLGITKKDKPFEFFNSEPTEFLRAVYKKAGITND